MSKPIRLEDGTEILHRHCFDYVFFTLWRGQECVSGERRIQKHRLDVDWKHPLDDEEIEFLRSGKMLEPKTLEEQAMDEVVKLISQLCDIRKLQDDLRELIRKARKTYGNEEVNPTTDRY